MSSFNTNYQRGGAPQNLGNKIFDDNVHRLEKNADGHRMIQKYIYSDDHLRQESDLTYGEGCTDGTTDASEGYFIIRPRQKDKLNELYADVQAIKKFLKDHFSFDPKKPVGDTSSGVDQAQTSLDEMIETIDKTNSDNTIKFDSNNKEQTSAALALLLTKWLKGDHIPELVPST